MKRLTIASACVAILMLMQSSVATAGQGQQKVAVCHVPPGNPAQARTLSLPEAGVRAHLDHGDVLGVCAGGQAKGKGHSSTASAGQPTTNAEKPATGATSGKKGSSTTKPHKSKLLF